MAKIAVVDDTEGIRNGTKLIIKHIRPDAEVLLYESGNAFLDNYLKDGPFGLVFLDINMHGKSGIEVLEEMRKLGYKDSVCVHSTIGYKSDSGDIARAHDEFGAEFLPKPPASDINDYRRVLENYGI